VAETGAARVVDVGARAKINLCLHVLGRRSDGYHTLESVVTFAELGDRLTVRGSSELSLRVSGPFAAAVPAGEANLALKAARLLAERWAPGRGAALVLDKVLPVAAGIGGGSADAAAAIRALIEFWELDMAPGDLETLALELGADVPVCLAGGTVLVGGIGDTLAPLPPLPDLPIVLVNPGVPLATATVFRALAGRLGRSRQALASVRSAAELLDLLGTCDNDLTAPACALVPAIGAGLDFLGARPGARLARMSGSGATCFALFDDAAAAEAAARDVLRQHPGWWAVATRLAPARAESHAC
jgi:4-diphosphocytidyl-2-C-methyl-D-erythritol kinase